jgi:glyceraldehyde 3-phosphate dehydrogenase
MSGKMGIVAIDALAIDLSYVVHVFQCDSDHGTFNGKVKDEQWKLIPIFQ